MITKILQIATKNLKEVFRDLKTHAIVFILPAVFISIFGFAFGSSTSSYQFDIGIVKSEDTQFQQYYDNLKEIKNGDDNSLFKIEEYENKQNGIEDLETKEISLLLVWNGAGDGVSFVGDTTNQTFGMASGYLAGYSNSFFGVDTSLTKTESIISDKEDFIIFQFIAPGLIIYSILILIPQVAGSLAKNKEKGLTLRYFTSKVSSTEIIFGYALSSIALSIIQTFIGVGTALLMGLEIPNSAYLPVLVIALLVNIFAVGVGLIIGGLTSKIDTASNLGTMASIVLGFMSGSFFQLPEVKVFDDFTLFEIVPSYHATQAMTSVITYEKSLSDISYQLAFLLLSGIVVFIIGALVYNYKQLKKIE